MPNNNQPPTGGRMIIGHCTCGSAFCQYCSGLLQQPIGPRSSPWFDQLQQQYPAKPETRLEKARREHAEYKAKLAAKNREAIEAPEAEKLEKEIEDMKKELSNAK